MVFRELNGFEHIDQLLSREGFSEKQIQKIEKFVNDFGPRSGVVEAVNNGCEVSSFVI